MGDRRATESLIRRLGAVSLGVIIGLAALEAMVRPFASVQLPPPPDIAHDSLAGPLIESRQIEEGVQTSHFTRGGSRWTGEPPMPGAPVIVIIGDSYVVAREVADDETMGAWVERLSREHGGAVNVRQYGWRAARPAQYVLEAPTVIARWSPARVIVVLSDNDFDSRALTDTMDAPPAQHGILAHSSLAMLVRHRDVLLDARAQHSFDGFSRRLGLKPSSTPSTEDPEVSPAFPPSPLPVVAPSDIEADVVTALTRSYGSRLAIVYVANTRVRDDADDIEHRLAAACTTQGVQYASTRGPMHALERRGIVTRGFSTTTLGSGHLNVDGHQMMGRLIWAMVRSR